MLLSGVVSYERFSLTPSWLFKCIEGGTASKYGETFEVTQSLQLKRELTDKNSNIHTHEHLVLLNYRRRMVFAVLLANSE